MYSALTPLAAIPLIIHLKCSVNQFTDVCMEGFTKMMILLAAVLVQLSLTTAQVGLYKCPSPWVDYKDKCYRFSFIQATLDKANQTCNNDGANLVSVNDRQEHEFLEEWMVDNSPNDMKWYTSGFKKRSGANKPEDQELLFYWAGDNTEVQGAQYWLTPEDRAMPGDRIIYRFDGVEWGWSLIEDPEFERSYVCEIEKKETYRILEHDRGFDYGSSVLGSSAWVRGPKFVTNPQDKVYENTQNNPVRFVEFRCEAESDPFPEYDWFRQRQDTMTKLDPGTDEKFTITNGRLVIHEPQDTKDNGDYLCTARNTIGSVMSSSATLRFGYLNDFSDTAREQVEVDAHKGIGIDCNPPKHGYDILSYSWYKDKFSNFIFTDRKPHIFISRDGKLYFSTATKDDEGKYTCVVAVPGITGGKHSMPIPLNVKESSGNIYEPEMVNGFPKVFPSSPLKDDDVYLECVAWGSTPLVYRWERVGHPFPHSAHLLDNNRVLHIPNVQVEHSGTYKCTVERRNGQQISKDTMLEIRAKPYFPISLSDQHVDKGADLTWLCYGKGAPGVDYLWYRDAEPLLIEKLVPADQERFSIDDNVLTILDVNKRDEGMYQCHISNELGSALSSAQLRTIAFPPTFDKYPLPPNQYATLRGNTTLICNPESAPPSEKIWKKDGRQVNAGTDEMARVRQLRNGNLHITRVQTSDAGTYTCQASNSLGDAQSTGNLTVLSSTEIEYSPLSNQQVQVNSTAFLQCDSTFNPTLDLTYDWWHNNYHIEFERLRIGPGNIAYFEYDEHFERGTGVDKGGMYINNVQQWHTGDYFCKVKTASDEVTAKSKLQVVGPPSPPAGVMGSNVNADSVDLTWWPGHKNGATIQYYIVEGFNIKEGTWRRLKTNIQGSTDIKVQVKEHVTGLSPGSQYRFRVRAVNEYGEGDPSDQTDSIHSTDSAPPTTFPRNLRGGGGKVGTLVMEWDPLPEAEHNGEGLRYIVYWKKSSVAEEDKWENEELPGTVTKYVHNVHPENYYSLYNIKIQARNDAGYGNISESVPIYSAEDMPVNVPRQVKAVYYNSTAIEVYFTSVEDTREAMRGVLLGYRINYWMTDVEEEAMAQFRIIKGQASHGIIIGLRPATQYTVNMQAFNSAGLTSVSEDYTTKTLRYAPKEAPQEVFLTINNDHEIELKWRGVSTTIDEEPLEGYKIRMWRRGENVYVAKDYDVGKKTRYIIDGLETHVVYETRVFGYSRGGVGLQSSPIIEFVLGNNCDVVEDSPEKDYVYLCDDASTIKYSAILLSAFITIKHLLHYLL